MNGWKRLINWMDHNRHAPMQKMVITLKIASVVINSVAFKAGNSRTESINKAAKR